MKNLTYLLCLIFSLFMQYNHVNAQKLLANQSGISLSYNSEYVSTLKCGDNSFDQYKITAYLENNSGHTIDIGYSAVEHTSHRNQLNVSPCKHPFPSGVTLSIKNSWANNSTDQTSYYVLVPSGERLPAPDWNLGRYTFKD